MLTMESAGSVGLRPKREPATGGGPKERVDVAYRLRIKLIFKNCIELNSVANRQPLTCISTERKAVMG